MSNQRLVSIEQERVAPHPGRTNGKVLLLKPPYFTPWTPPLGIAILKAFLERHGYSAQCFDFNTDSDLWGMHHKYFAAVQTLENISINDGYSKLWWILNAHMLARANEASPAAIAKMLATIIPLYGMKYNQGILQSLISLVERFFQKLEGLIAQMELSDYAVVGTSTYTTSLATSLYILKRVKGKNPRIRTVMGGGVFADDLALGSDNLETLLREYAFIDHVVLGEGELLLLKLLQGEFVNQRVISLADLKGTNLNMKEVPAPDFSDFNLDSYYHLTIEGARSCPFQCSFCSETIQWGEYRKKPVDLLSDQVIELAGSYKNNSFFMGDSLMNPYIAGFANALLERKANILYDGYLRADKPVAYRDKVKIWARSGLYRARLGIESAASRVLESMDKMTTPKVISEALKSLANAGIRTTTYWIVGFPGETEQDFQETLDFIREHHRYIYELEAHPYYYYPYGQVGSRLYQCHSLYPDEVTDVIKFKVWEITGVEPTREERYERLRTISKLAAGMGLPNIYSMAERYQAEERWHRLHPLATQVYEGSWHDRPCVQLPPQPVNAFCLAQGFPNEPASSIRNVLCYQVTVQKTLNETILAESLRQLVRHNEMLQMRLQEGKYIPMPEGIAEMGGAQPDLYAIEENGAEGLEVQKERLVEKLAGNMKPDPGACVRLALIRRRDGFSELIFLAHRLIADSKSVLLLLEDLFRVYEQVENNREISLRPAPKTYTAFINKTGPRADSHSALPSEWPTRPAAGRSNGTAISGQPEIPCVEIASKTIPIEPKHERALFSDTVKAFGLKPDEVLLAAITKSALKTRGADVIAMDLSIDQRLLDTTLAQTVGALTRMYAMSDAIIGDCLALSQLRNLSRDVQSLPSTETKAGTEPPGEKSAGSDRMLLNFEYFNEEPWLGGDAWVPQRFLIPDGNRLGAHVLEVLPILSKSEIQIRLIYKRLDRAEALVEGIAHHLPTELETILQYGEDYVAARALCESEFRSPAAALDLEAKSHEITVPINGRGLEPIRIPRSLWNRLHSEADINAPILALASYSVALSRLTGREDMMILTAIADHGETGLVPLRLYPCWNKRFKDFVQEVEHKLQRTSRYRNHVLQILTADARSQGEGFICPPFEAAFMYPDADQGVLTLRRVLKGKPPWRNHLYVTLEVVGSPEDVSLRVVNEKVQNGAALASAVRSYLERIFLTAIDDLNTRIEDIVIDNSERALLEQATAIDEFDGNFRF